MNPLKKKVYLYQITFSTKDAVFLYHLKHDAYTKAVVKDVTAKIIFSKGQEKSELSYSLLARQTNHAFILWY